MFGPSAFPMRNIEFRGVRSVRVGFQNSPTATTARFYVAIAWALSPGMGAAVKRMLLKQHWQHFRRSEMFLQEQFPKSIVGRRSRFLISPFFRGPRSIVNSCRLALCDRPPVTRGT
jgi:hypothetical protein